MTHQPQVRERVAAPGSRHEASRIAIVCLGLVLAGCASSPERDVTYHDENMDFSLVQTVVVMPFANLTGMNTAGERVRDVFMTMLQATGAAYVLPPGEVARGISRAKVSDPAAPTAEEAVALGQQLKADVVVTGTVREYGEVRSGNAAANVVSVSVQMIETQAGKVVWSASATAGGVSGSDRMFGGGGEPMNVETEAAIRDLIRRLFE
jgi:hypothetical protein